MERDDRYFANPKKERKDLGDSAAKITGRHPAPAEGTHTPMRSCSVSRSPSQK